MKTTGNLLQSFLDQWEEQVEKLINITAKKAGAIDTKHQQIVQGTCELFFKKGFHPTSMRDIAKASGMSLGQIYHYIASKDDVLFLIHKHMQTTLYQHLADAGIEGYKDPVVRLEKALYASLDFLIEHKKLIQFIYTESKYLSKEHLRVVLEMDSKNVSGYWCDLVGEAYKQQGITSDVLLAGNIVSYNLVFVSMRGWNLKGKSKEELTEYLVDFICKGLGISRPGQSEVKQDSTLI